MALETIPSPQPGSSKRRGWSSHPWLRWLIPGAAVMAIIGGGAAVGAIRAAADPPLPPRSAAQLLVDLQTARVDGLSGTIVYTANLGLPALPGVAVRGGTDLTSLLAGTHTLRIWYSGPDHARVALLGTLGETDVITDGQQLWIWSSKENKAIHRTVPIHATPGGPGPLPDLSAAALTPQQIADAALAAIEPSTAVTVGQAVRVAGRQAYELVLAPRDEASLVGSIRVAIDASKHVPTRVQIIAHGRSEPAIEAAFTQVSFARPGSEHFGFRPPPGASVDETPPSAAVPNETKPPSPPAFATVGSGWTRILVVRLANPPVARADQARGDGHSDDGWAGLSRIIETLPSTNGSWGSGKVLTSALFSALLTDDGRLLIGTVTPERLFLAAGDPAARLGP